MQTQYFFFNKEQQQMTTSKTWRDEAAQAGGAHSLQTTFWLLKEFSAHLHLWWNSVYTPFLGVNPNSGQPVTLLLIIIPSQILSPSSRERNSFTPLLMRVRICFSRCTTEEFFVSPAPLCCSSSLVALSHDIHTFALLSLWGPSIIKLHLPRPLTLGQPQQIPE